MGRGRSTEPLAGRTDQLLLEHAARSGSWAVTALYGYYQTNVEAMTEEVLRLTAQIVSAHAAHNAVSADALPALIQSVYNTLLNAGTPAIEPEKLQPAVPVKKSVFPDHIVCLEDGKKLKMLKRHLKTVYNMTPEQDPRAVEPAPRLPDGGTQLRREAVGPRQVDRPRAQAGRRRAGGAAQDRRAVAERCQGGLTRIRSRRRLPAHRTGGQFGAGVKKVAAPLRAPPSLGRKRPRMQRAEATLRDSIVERLGATAKRFLLHRSISPPLW